MQGVPLGQEIIDQQHVLALGQETLGNDDGVDLLLGEGVNLGHVLVSIQVDGLGLLGKDDRYVAEVPGGQAGDADA